MDNSWNAGSWIDSNSLGTEISNYIYDEPEWGIYIRRDYRFECPQHFDAASKSPIHEFSYCPLCLGLGVKSTAMIVPSRVNLGPTKISVRESDVLTDPGMVQYFVTSIDMPRNVKPKLEDILIYCQWDKPINQMTGIFRPRPLRVNKMYLIKAVNDHFERQLSWVCVGVAAFDYTDDWANQLMIHFAKLPVLPVQQGPTYW